jgi:cyclophilin family peptidyl-prolyl cis-trans isomerase
MIRKFFYLFIFFFSLVTTTINAKNNIMILKLTYGSVELELYPEKAPNHVKRFKELADSGKYDGVVFHRVIDGFMAQTGDVKFGNSNNADFNLSMAGTGGSDLPDLKAEFTDIAHIRGILSAARSADPDSANSQFFICLDSAPHLDRQYSAFGKVIKGMEFIDMIKKGDPNSGSVPDPDKIISLKSK